MVTCPLPVLVLASACGVTRMPPIVVAAAGNAEPPPPPPPVAPPPPPHANVQVRRSPVLIWPAPPVSWVPAAGVVQPEAGPAPPLPPAAVVPPTHSVVGPVPVPPLATLGG